MRCKRWWARPGAAGTILPALAAVLTAALAGGCDEPAMKGKSAPAAGTRPSTPAVNVADAQPAGATQPHTSPADTQPATAFLTIEGRATEFPPARLRLKKTDEGVTALLYSDDPKTATSAKYAGNSFYFELPLRIKDPADVGDAQYWEKAEDSEPSDTNNGIFLSGTKYHLQPKDVAIRFDADGNKVMAELSGRFLVVRTTDDNAPGQFTAVQGTLYTTAEVEE